ncbi:Trishanku [Tetrabaena socialis]|uniref:Trishanku n=1 Tax=Tetrabaena socialis TaxID=47790 RepID=A0A2J8AAD6_9CHLO|nr:Trishanku [Tetrabaena socialis]|eukprot:PNH09484.1 Trishanku [Tetrabaena socialis]
MQKCSVSLPKRPTGLVVRPAAAGSGGSPQTLVFFADEVRTLEGGSEGEPFRLGPQLALTDGACSGGGGSAYALQQAGCAVLDPSSGCVFFAEGNAVMRLSPSNVVSLAAGSKEQQSGSRVDGVGEAARFTAIRALAADGRGGADVGTAAPQQASYTVTTLVSSAPGHPEWRHLAYDSSADMLLAATYLALVSVPLPGSSGDGAGQVRLLAGQWRQSGSNDGCGTAARFDSILGMLSGADHRIHVADYQHLRRVDGHSTVSTVCSSCFTYSSSCLPTYYYMAILPSGQLAAAVATGATSGIVIIGGGFAPSSQLQGSPIRERVMKHLVAAPYGSSSASAGRTDSASGGVAMVPRRSKRLRGSGDAGSSHSDSDKGGSSGIVVTVKVGDRAFAVHRSLLAERSEYFKQLFEGSFADSGAAEVTLPDADPDAFAAILGFTYWGVLEVPYNLLRPAAELAERLLMPHICQRLTARLLVGCTPATAVSDLLWAERHNMGVVGELKAFFVQHAKEVVEVAPAMVDQLAATSPQLAAQLICALASRTKCFVSLSKRPTGLVVRPAAAGSGSPPQTLVFFADEVRMLEGGSRGEPCRLGPRLLLTDGASPGSGYAMRAAGRAAVFEPTSGCIFFSEGNTVMRLDGGNVVTLVAGGKDEQPASVDGAGEAARFGSIMALAADGRGAVFVAERSCIRKLSLNGAGSNAATERAAAVTTLSNTAPPAYHWTALAYSAAGGVLLAASLSAVYSTSLPEGGNLGGQPQLLLAGAPSATGDAGTAARFNRIHSMLVGASGCVYIADSMLLRKLDVAQRTVSTVQGCSCQGRPPTSLTILPSGHMVCASQSSTDLQVLAGIFASCSLLPKARAWGQEAAEELVKHLQAPAQPSSSASAGSANACGAAGDAGDASGSHGASGNSSADISGVVTVRVGDKATIAHRSLLAYHSDFFKQLFDSGFADSSAAEIMLSEADPDAFGWLLAYMYRGFLEVPYNLLRPAGELAERLLMPSVCAELAGMLLAGCTPVSAVGDLLWAERHNMGELVAQLKV